MLSKEFFVFFLIGYLLDRLMFGVKMYLIFEVLSAMIAEISIFWDISTDVFEEHIS
jgi:hypothetical protein